jgi:threonine dehydratase
MDIDAIRDAAVRIKPHIRRTPLERSGSISGHLGANVFVKYELFQKTGSFKVRGAFNKLLSLTDEERSRGVVAVSGGNHAQAVAYASGVLGVDAVIAMPENTPANYLDATRAYGATVEMLPTIADAFRRMEELASKGLIAIHPFDDPVIVAGQGTIGLEILEDLPETTDVVVSIGGGGLAAGVATALKAAKPSIRVWGVETTGADAMSQALAADAPVTLPSITSIAKTLGAPFVTEMTLCIAQQLLEDVIVVTDAEAVRSMAYIAERLKVLTEPAASCTLAAAEHLAANFGPESNVVLIFCGGNTSLSDACRFLELSE